MGARSQGAGHCWELGGRQRPGLQCQVPGGQGMRAWLEDGPTPTEDRISSSMGHGLSWEPRLSTGHRCGSEPGMASTPVPACQGTCALHVRVRVKCVRGPQ